MMKGGRRAYVFEGADNIRDLAGIKTKDGRTVKSGRLVRADGLGNLSAGDIRFLTEEMQVKTAVDFRTAEERRDSPEPELPGVEMLWIPLLNEQVEGITHEQDEEDKKQDPTGFLGRLLASGLDGRGYMETTYRELAVTAKAREGYRRFFKVLLARKEGAVLWHCSKGKDRTGIGAALTLFALGVSEEAIYEDYQKTNDYLREQIEASMASVRRKVANEKLREDIHALHLAQESYLAAYLDEVRKGWGSPDAFLERELGVGRAEKERLRELYLEE